LKKNFDAADVVPGPFLPLRRRRKHLSLVFLPGTAGKSSLNNAGSEQHDADHTTFASLYMAKPDFVD